MPGDWHQALYGHKGQTYDSAIDGLSRDLQVAIQRIRELESDMKDLKQELKSFKEDMGYPLP